MSYYDRYREERLAYQKMYNEANKERCSEYQKEYYNKVTKLKYNIATKASLKCNPTKKSPKYDLPPDRFKVVFD
jgi:hypothetical protein